MRHHAMQRIVYNGFVMPVVYGLFPAAARLHPKLRLFHDGRKNIRRRWSEQARRIDGRPIWFHVSSVGEYEQARPVIGSLESRFPEIPVVLTFSSPSGFSYATGKERRTGNVKFIDYLPLDSRSNARFCLATLDPRLLVFVKFDLWPNLIWEARERGTPSILIDATLSRGSYRLTTLGRRFYRSVYNDLDRILAISEPDALRFSACVPDHRGISIAGDTRFDRVIERKRNHRRPAMEKGRRTVVLAGSTWPKDESRLLPALSRLAAAEKDLLLIIAPHEPSRERVTGLREWAESRGLQTATWNERSTLSPAADRNQALIIDTVGVLAEAYSIADIAYIGGSFSTGVHSVIEPAVMGIPVLFGPAHKNSFEAIRLLENEAAFSLHNAEEICNALTSLVRNPDARIAMGNRARLYVESQCGATHRCMETITNFIDTAGAQASAGQVE